MTVSLAPQPQGRDEKPVPPQASGGTTDSDSRSSSKAWPAQERVWLLAVAMCLAAGLLVGALLLLGVAIGWSRSHPDGFGVNGDSIRFGGGARGWQASPALVAMVAAAVLLLLAVMLAFQVIDRVGDEPKAPEAAKAGKAA